MRKHLLLPSLLAISLLSLGSGLAMACDGAKTTSTASAASGKCASKADASTASVDGKSASAADCSAACMAACTAAKTASAAGNCGGATAIQTAGAGGHCNSGASTKTAAGDACQAKGDFFISSYLCLSEAAKGHCAVSMQTAASKWNEGLQAMIASGKAAEHTEALKALAAQLADWPMDAAAADARFRAVSEWTAGYCERFPAKTAGAKVMTCSETGKRWVELETAAADGQS
jgi:hypothetical protein